MQAQTPGFDFQAFLASLSCDSLQDYPDQQLQFNVLENTARSLGLSVSYMHSTTGEKKGVWLKPADGGSKWPQPLGFSSVKAAQDYLRAAS